MFKITIKDSGLRDYPYAAYINGVFIDDFINKPTNDEVMRIFEEQLREGIQEIIK